jgi:hypothetical protein
MDILNGTNGFDENDAKIAAEVLRKNGYSEEMIEQRKAGNVSGFDLKITYLTLNADNATYHGIAMNFGDGKLRYDSQRSVGQQDTIAIIEFTDSEGNKRVYPSRVECSGGELQDFAKITVPTTPEVETPTPEEPQTPPPATPITPPEVVPQTFSASYCSALDAQGKEIIEQVSGFSTQAEAEEAAAKLNQPCVPEDTTTTTEVEETTTTTQPTSTTSTTSADKDPTQTTVPVPSTTVPPTTPEEPTETRPDATVSNNNVTQTTAVQKIAGAVTLGAIGNPETRQAGLPLWGSVALVGTAALLRAIKKRKLK